MICKLTSDEIVIGLKEEDAWGKIDCTTCMMNTFDDYKECPYYPKENKEEDVSK